MCEFGSESRDNVGTTTNAGEIPVMNSGIQMTFRTAYWSPIQTIPLEAAKLRNQIMIAMPPMTIPATMTILNNAIAKVMGPDFFFLRAGFAARVRRERIRSNASSTSESSCEYRDWEFSTIRRPAFVPETSDLAILELLQ